jgi:hypothetical protein
MVIGINSLDFVRVEPRVGQQPPFDVGRLAGGAVVQDQMNPQTGREFPVQLREGLLELRRAVAAVEGADDLAGGDYQDGEQGRGAGPDVVVAAAIDLVDQWVAPLGLSSTVLTMNRSTSASVIFRGTPGRGSSHKPSRTRSMKRRRQVRTVSAAIRS